MLILPGTGIARIGAIRRTILPAFHPPAPGVSLAIAERKAVQIIQCKRPRRGCILPPIGRAKCQGPQDWVSSFGRIRIVFAENLYFMVVSPLQLWLYGCL